MGFTAAWVYAAIRPRFGAGIRTAVYAAVAVWFVGYLTADASFAIIGVLPVGLVATLIVVGFLEIIVATVAGAYFYREAPA